MPRKTGNTTNDLDDAINSVGGSGGADSGSGSGGSDSGSDSFGSGSGTGSGDSGGSGTGTGKRRGRPRKTAVPVEVVGEPANPSLTESKSSRRGRKSGPDLGVLIDTTVVGLFGLVAVATAHEHWLKDRDDVMPITGPLKAWVDQLPAKTLKKLEQNLAPTLFVAGLATVLGPDVIAEVKLRGQAKQRALLAVPFPQAGGRSAVPVAGNPSGANSNGDGRPSSAGRWAGSIPAAPDLGTPLDL